MDGLPLQRTSAVVSHRIFRLWLLSPTFKGASDTIPQYDFKLPRYASMYRICMSPLQLNIDYRVSYLFITTSIRKLPQIKIESQITKYSTVSNKPRNAITYISSSSWVEFGNEITFLNRYSWSGVELPLPQLQSQRGFSVFFTALRLT